MININNENKARYKPTKCSSTAKHMSRMSELFFFAYCFCLHLWDKILCANYKSWFPCLLSQGEEKTNWAGEGLKAGTWLSKQICTRKNKTPDTCMCKEQPQQRVQNIQNTWMLHLYSITVICAEMFTPPAWKRMSYQRLHDNVLHVLIRTNILRMITEAWGHLRTTTIVNNGSKDTPTNYNKFLFL